jgi:hypothetical protein
MSGLMPASETESSFADAERAAFIRYRTPDLLCGWLGAAPFHRPELHSLRGSVDESFPELIRSMISSFGLRTLRKSPGFTAVGRTSRPA